MRILNQFFTHLLYVTIYAGLQIFIQLSQTLKNRLLNEKHYPEPGKWKRKERDRRYSIGRSHKMLEMVINMNYEV